MYEVILSNRVEKALEKLPGKVYERVLRALRNLAGDPRPVGSLKLRGSELRRVRVGDYRIIYGVDDESRGVTIVKIAHRRESYR